MTKEVPQRLKSEKGIEVACINGKNYIPIFFYIIDKKTATFHTCRTYILNETVRQMAENTVKRERERIGN